MFRIIYNFIHPLQHIRCCRWCQNKVKGRWQNVCSHRSLLKAQLYLQALIDPPLSSPFLWCLSSLGKPCPMARAPHLSTSGARVNRSPQVVKPTLSPDCPAGTSSRRLSCVSSQEPPQCRLTFSVLGVGRDILAGILEDERSCIAPFPEDADDLCPVD